MTMDPKHHLRSISGGWSAWRWVCVRSAGFPIDEPQALAAPELRDGLDALGELDARIAALTASLVEAGRAARDAAAGDARSAWTKLLKKLERGARPDAIPSDAGEPLVARVRELAGLAEAREARLHELERAFAAAAVSAGHALRRWAAEPRFREALLVQNPDALRTAADPLLGHPAGTSNYKTRRLEQMIANYLQRYCTKNDTISFFGPMGWAELGAEDSASSFRCGEQLLRRRELFFEHWMIDALADVYSERPELRRHLPPRPSPTVRREGDELVVPIEQRIPLPPALATVLELCDGQRPAAEIAARACELPELELAGEAEVFELLEDLVAKKVLIWRLEIPTVGRRFERILRDQLEALPGCAARTEALEQLAQIEAAFAALEASRGDPERMASAGAELARCFGEQTGKSASRKGGAIYAARTIVYEDCVRDIDLTIGDTVLRGLGPPLALLAHSARWCTYEIARGYRQIFEQTYAQMVASGGGDEIPYLQFWEQIAPHLSNRNDQVSPVVEAVGAELQARWREILQLDETAAGCQRSSEALRAKVLERLAAPHPGWPGARFHSPDVMIAARSVEAIDRGDALFVLGELHPSINNLCLPLFLHQHPTPDELVRARELDLPQVCAAPVTSRHHTTRSDHNWTSRQNVDVELGDTISWRPRERVVAVADLVVARGPAGLEVRTRDGRHRFEIIAFFEYQIIAGGMARLSILPPLPHSPRVTIDRLVVARETWRFPRAELELASIEDRFARFRAIDAWRRRHGLPRFVFFRASQEWKPCYLDFESPVYVDTFAQLARQAEHVTMSEMLPGFEDAWLTDAAERRYASELRLVLVDPAPMPGDGELSAGGR